MADALYSTEACRGAVREAAEQLARERQSVLADQVARLHADVWQQVVAAQAALCGDETAVGPLADGTVLVTIRGHAERVAQGATQTLLSDAEGFATAIEEPLSEGELQEAFGAWLAARGAWKGQQIAATEASVAYHDALRGFTAANGLEGQWEVHPLSTSGDGACDELVDGNPYDQGEAMSLDLPAHPNCVHFLVCLGYDEATVPDQLWTGDQP